ncbi:MAG: GNAT family N-acetyltransferase [Caulobacter sp.]|nr:GNAT family N-acetyltransferase [Caulobacter sp.]
MALEPATPEDIPAIIAIETIPGYEVFISSWSAREHAAGMASLDVAHLVWREHGMVAAFAILEKLTDPNRIVLVRRLGAARTDTGLGRRFIPALMDRVFETTHCNRLELGVSEENPRAQRVYHREGFHYEGTKREIHRHEDGRYVSSLTFSILRREWEALPRRRMTEI